ncbi:MAG: ATP-NAD kinase family protein, partial [Candidatus Thermoplasmatota archaeon]
MKRVGFFINPIAGMGGRVGLKGTDGMLEEALQRGAKPVAPHRAKEFFEFFEKMNLSERVKWYTVDDPMGFSICKSGEIVYSPKREITTRKDTINAVREFLKINCDIIVFCGGDGTARDIVSVVKKKLPILGIPSGVKMHSGVFATTPDNCARVLAEFLNGKLRVGEAEIMDVDEDAYRKGIWKVKLFDICLTPTEPEFMQGSKCVIEIDEKDILDGIAEHLKEEMEKEPKTLFILGPGSTIAYISKKIGIEKTILGIDCVFNNKIILKDVNEEDLINLLKKYKKAKIVLSPIGGQGFVLGRGNQQISEKVLRYIEPEDLIIAATPAKLSSISSLRFDIPDKEAMDKFKNKKYYSV